MARAPRRTASRMLDRMIVPHEPSDECWDDHCYIHNLDEPVALVPNSKHHTVCSECGHLYPTRRALRREHKRRRGADGGPGWWRGLLASRPWPRRDLSGWHSLYSTWKYLRLTIFLRAKDIWVCPFCAHDF